MKIKDIEILTNLPDLTEEETKRYVEYVSSRVDNVKTISIKSCADGKVDVNYFAQGLPFERIRRITGYLTGDLKSWNDAKQSEEHERVKHNAERLQAN